MTMLQKLCWSVMALAMAAIAAMCLWLLISVLIVSTSTRVTGRVVHLIRETSDKDVYYCPVTKFRDAEGQEHTIRSSSGSNPPRFSVGSTVPVLYRPNNPSDGFLEDPLLLWYAPLILIGISLFYGSAGFFIHRAMRNKGAPPII